MDTVPLIISKVSKSINRSFGTRGIRDLFIVSRRAFSFNEHYNAFAARKSAPILQCCLSAHL